MLTNRLLLAMVMAASLAGCSTTMRVTNPALAEHGGNDEDSQLLFWHTLADRPITGNDDAFHGMLLFLNANDDAGSYADRLAALRARGLLPAGFNEPADAPVRRGTVAVMLVKLLDMKGGWAMHVFGPNPRYALRELQYKGLMPYSSPQQTFTGMEYVGVIGALEDYQSRTGRRQAAREPATTAPSVGG